MPRIKSFELYAVDLPFRKPFKHAAAVRTKSSSLFLKCTLSDGSFGFGESLPRSYVTGESRDAAFETVLTEFLPRLLDLGLNSIDAVKSFLYDCNGKGPAQWADPDKPQTAAWCVVDLALLDAFARSCQQPIWLDDSRAIAAAPAFSPVISSEVSFKTLLLIRLGRFRTVKLKLDRHTSHSALRRCRRLLGSSCDIRADANMAWDVNEAEQEMKSLVKLGIRSFEQPIAADNLDGLADLIRRCPGIDIMVDESLHDDESLQALIQQQACTAVNVRISKCGGLIASQRRCRDAAAAGLRIQLGCQVGESSLLSGAQLKLLASVNPVAHLEGCFGRHLLKQDPGQPLLQFGLRGRPPELPNSPGLGISIDEQILRRYTSRHECIGS